MNPSPSSEPALGLVVHCRDGRPDAALAAAARRLQAAGLRVAGLLQAGTKGDPACCATLALEDIGSGRRVPIFERRAAAARGCRLDPSGLAEAAGWLRDAIEGRPDILFVNRFGRQESEGRGLIDEIAAAVLAGIPVVVAVGEALLPQWRDFAGEAGTALPADPDRIAAWCLAQREILPA